MTVRKQSSTNNLNRLIAIEKCPVTYTLGKIGGRWKPLIIWHLGEGKRRYSELRRALPHVTEKMLIQQLKELEQDGLLLRLARPVVPPFVEYQLSEKGEQLNPILAAMANWGLEHSK